MDEIHNTDIAAKKRAVISQNIPMEQHHSIITYPSVDCALNSQQPVLANSGVRTQWSEVVH